MLKLTSVPSSSATALTTTFPSSVASTVAKVLDEVTDLTRRRDLCTLQEIV